MLTKVVHYTVYIHKASSVNTISFPFIFIYSNGHLEVVKYLIEKNECEGCLSCTDKNNHTPMQLACQ